MPLKTREGAGLRLGCSVAGRRLAEGGCLLDFLSVGSLRKNHLLRGSCRSSRSEGPVGSEAGQREGKEAAAGWDAGGVVVVQGSKVHAVSHSLLAPGF